MSPVKKIVVESVEVSILESPNRDDYFSITDMMKAKDGEFFVTDWLRNRNTLEYLGAWESMNNPNFNYGEFATIRNQAGLNSLKSVLRNGWRRQEQLACLPKLAVTAGRMLTKILLCSSVCGSVQFFNCT